jgi:hypothetical protein
MLRAVDAVLRPHCALALWLAGPYDGWRPVAEVDHRQPPRPRAGLRGAGPWRDGDTAVHGLVERERPDGLVDGAAVCHGWCLWRWAGPRMGPVLTPAGRVSPLISPWNPILAQDLMLEDMGWLGVPGWGVDEEDWTAQAVLQGHKTGGYFGLPPRRMDTWRSAAAERGIEVDHVGRAWWAPFGAAVATVAQPGTLGEHVDLAELAEQYQRVLPAELAAEVAEDLAANANRQLLDLVRNFDDVGHAVRGLALGYPPEVTAGGLLTHGHRHPVQAAEFGAYCPACARTERAHLAP